MANSATSFSRNGVSDWLTQRVSAVILAAYVVTVLGYLMCSGEVTFSSWSQFINWLPMQIFTMIAMLALTGHAMVGMWTISTDYIKPTGLRILFQLLCALALLVYLIWTVVILWG